jgi:DNA/RNA endonuclease YhcR with UshA esterase domain
MTESVAGPDRNESGGLFCAECGHYVGAMSRCPHCGARAPRRTSLKIYRASALILATAGLLLLYVVAARKDIPLIAVGDIAHTMNFGFVRIEGVVTAPARVFSEAGRVTGVRFEVDDGTGILPVSAYRGKARALLERDLVPRPGDRVSVAGSLSVSADRTILYVQAPDHVRLDRLPVNVLAPSRIGVEREGQPVAVEGAVVSVREPESGTRRPWQVELEDAEGRCLLVFWDDVAAPLPDGLLATGRWLRASGTVSVYRDRAQVLIQSPSDLRPTQRSAGTEEKPGA